VKDSFGETEAEYKKLGFEADNTILKKDAEQMKKLGIHHNPAITINDYLYRGDLDGQDIFEGICSTFRTKKLRPKYCDRTFDIQTVLGHIEDLSPPGGMPINTVKLFHLFMIVLIIVGVNLGILVVYRRW